MKNSKLAVALTAVGMIVFGCVNQAFASGVGYIDYQKVYESYPLAQQAIKEIDAKGLEIQQFMVDKEKQYKALDTPLKKQNFEEATAKEFAAKQDAYIQLKNQKDELIFNNIENAAKRVMVEQGLDTILIDKAIFVGGVDVTDKVISKLKSGN